VASFVIRALFMNTCSPDAFALIAVILLKSLRDLLPRGSRYMTTFTAMRSFLRRTVPLARALALMVPRMRGVIPLQCFRDLSPCSC